PLVRRLSAVALFIIFNAAVWPFGRIDLVGHALIMAIIVAIAVDPTRELHFLPKIRNALANVPVALGAALVIFGLGDWGLHLGLYGPQEWKPLIDMPTATHTFDPEKPHEAPLTPAPAGSHTGHGGSTTGPVPA